MTTTTPNTADLVALARKCGASRAIGNMREHLTFDRAGLEAFAAALAVPQPSDERAAFEAWRRQETAMKDKDDAVAREGFGDDARYVNRHTRAMWYAWQRRALRATPASTTSEPSDSERLAWLHSINDDADGWQYGVAKVRFKADGNPEFLWTVSDHSDIDPLILAARKAPAAQDGGAAS